MSNTASLFDLIARNSVNLERWIKNEISDADFYTNKAAIEAAMEKL